MRRRSTSMGSPGRTPSWAASCWLAASAPMEAFPRDGTMPALMRASWSEPVSRSARRTTGAQRGARTAVSSATASPSARRTRQSSTTSSPRATRRSPRSGSVGGRTRRRMMREVGTRPWRRISCEKVIRKLARRCVGGSATKVPRPGSRRTRPSSASCAMACRAVMRLTPNSVHRSASEGRRWPGRRVAMRSRSADSISR